MEKAYVINGIKKSSIRNIGDSEEEREEWAERFFKETIAVNLGKLGHPSS